MTFEDESYRNALTECSPALSKILEPFNSLCTEFDTDFVEYFNLNYRQFVKTNPTIKKIKENFVNVNQMQEKLKLLPFYAVGRMIEIDFKELKASLMKRVDNYK